MPTDKKLDDHKPTTVPYAVTKEQELPYWDDIEKIIKETSASILVAMYGAAVTELKEGGDKDSHLKTVQTIVKEGERLAERLMEIGTPFREKNLKGPIDINNQDDVQYYAVTFDAVKSIAMEVMEKMLSSAKELAEANTDLDNKSDEQATGISSNEQSK